MKLEPKEQALHPSGQERQTEEAKKYPLLHWVQLETSKQVSQPAGHPAHTPLTLKVLAEQVMQL